MRRRLVTLLVTLVVAVAAAFVAVRIAHHGDTDVGDLGAGPYADYCAEVQRQQGPLTDAAAIGGAQAFIAMLPSYQALNDKAPDDLVDDWAVLIDRVGRLQRAYADADVDAASFDLTDPPDGTSDADIATITTALESVFSVETSAALDAVQQQALDVCHVPLSFADG